jgi:MFS family permease
MASISERIRTATAPGNRKLTAFFAVLVLSLVPYVLVADILPAVVLGWTRTMDFGIHQLHEMMFGAFLLAGLIGLLVQFRAPRSKVSPMLGVVGVFVVVAIVTTAASGIDPFILLFVIPPIVVALLHPAGRELVRVDRARVNYVLFGLTVVAAVPLAAFALNQWSLQATIADEHTTLGHWAVMAGLSLGMVVLGLVTSLRQRGWRITAWLTGLLVAYFGALSVAFPGIASSVPTVWAVAAFAWAVAFVGMSEVAYRAEPSARLAPPRTERPV